jgi:hypothetical protein
LARLGIPAREIAGGLETMGFKESRWDENFLPDDLATIKSGRFLDLIRPHVVRNAGRQRNLLFEYLEREGVLADSRYGLVDVGWHATLQDCLARVLEVRNAQIGTGLYFGLMDYQLNERFGRKTAYFMDLQQGLGFRFRMPDLYYLIEAMCAGSEGTASSFERSGEGNEVRPVLKSKENHAIIAWGLPKVHETIVSFADNLLLDPALISTDSDTREAVARVLEQFWFFPSATEAQTIVDFPFEGGMDGDVSRWVAARKYDWMHIGKSLIYGDFYRDSGVFWHEGSLALTSGFKKAALKGAARLGKCLRHPKSELHAFRDFCKTRIP